MVLSVTCRMTPDSKDHDKREKGFHKDIIILMSVLASNFYSYRDHLQEKLSQGT